MYLHGCTILKKVSAKTPTTTCGGGAAVNPAVREVPSVVTRHSHSTFLRQIKVKPQPFITIITYHTEANVDILYMQKLTVDAVDPVLVSPNMNVCLYSM